MTAYSVSVPDHLAGKELKFPLRGRNHSGLVPHGDQPVTSSSESVATARLEEGYLCVKVLSQGKTDIEVGHRNSSGAVGMLTRRLAREERPAELHPYLVLHFSVTHSEPNDLELDVAAIEYPVDEHSTAEHPAGRVDR